MSLQVQTLNRVLQFKERGQLDTFTLVFLADMENTVDLSLYRLTKTWRTLRKKNARGNWAWNTSDLGWPKISIEL
jgi:hypothetical protein